MPRLENHSHSQYLVCTRTKHITSNDVIPVLGFGLLQEPCVVVTLLNTGKVVDLPVVDLDFYSNEPTDLLLGPIKQVNQIVSTFKNVSTFFNIFSMSCNHFFRFF